MKAKHTLAYQIRHARKRLGAIEGSDRPVSAERLAALVQVSGASILIHGKAAGSPSRLFLAAWERFLADHPDLVPPSKEASAATNDATTQPADGG